LTNNAGVGLIHDSFSDMRTAYNRTFDVNVTSVALAMNVFLPLLRDSVSSSRGSLELSFSGQLPPTVAMAYCASKTALNMLTVEYGKASENHNVVFQSVSPGHCKTEFNNCRGRTEPLDGAKVIVALLSADSGDLDGGGRYNAREGSVVIILSGVHVAHENMLTKC
jgi:NAD(P)-dependent dehydrogenase (short-subunit alcohol dehydrogenase family)